MDGDFYINTTTNTIFGPKTSGTWGSGTSLIGPQGPQGNTGATGAQGPAGSDATSALAQYKLVEPGSVVNTTESKEMQLDFSFGTTNINLDGGLVWILPSGVYKITANLYARADGPINLFLLLENAGDGVGWTVLKTAGRSVPDGEQAILTISNFAVEIDDTVNAEIRVRINATTNTALIDAVEDLTVLFEVINQS